MECKHLLFFSRHINLALARRPQTILEATGHTMQMDDLKPIDQLLCETLAIILLIFVLAHLKECHWPVRGFQACMNIQIQTHTTHPHLPNSHTLELPKIKEDIQIVSAQITILRITQFRETYLFLSISARHKAILAMTRCLSE